MAIKPIWCVEILQDIVFKFQDYLKNETCKYTKLFFAGEEHGEYRSWTIIYGNA